MAASRPPERGLCQVVGPVSSQSLDASDHVVWQAGSLRFEDMFRDTWKKRRAQGTGGVTSSSQAIKTWQVRPTEWDHEA